MNEPYLERTRISLYFIFMTRYGKKTASNTMQDATDVSVDCLDQTLRSRLVNHDVYINLYLAL